jgi:uncharacterized protein (DUF1810 family)
MKHNEYRLDKFLDAQERVYETALAEIRSGRKQSHWMWYIFPQIAGLGFSDISRRFAIGNLSEAKAYLEHPLLGKRLIEISNALLNVKSKNATQIMGSPDDVKLRSFMTLFSCVPGADPVFQSVLDKFFRGSKDNQTIKLLHSKTMEF